LAKYGRLKTLVLTLPAPLVDVIDEHALVAFQGEPHSAVRTGKGRQLTRKRRWRWLSRGAVYPTLSRKPWGIEFTCEPPRRPLVRFEQLTGDTELLCYGLHKPKQSSGSRQIEAVCLQLANAQPLRRQQVLRKRDALGKKLRFGTERRLGLVGYHGPPGVGIVAVQQAGSSFASKRTAEPGVP